MATTQIIEPVYVFEEDLGGGVVAKIAFSTHRRLESGLTQDILILMRTVLAAIIRVMDAVLRRRTKRDGRCSDRSLAIPQSSAGDRSYPVPAEIVL